MKLISIPQIAAAVLLGLPWNSLSLAECNCQTGGVAGGVSSAPIPLGPSVMEPAGLGLEIYSQSIETRGAIPGVNDHPAPPLGTIGQTYQLPSKPVPIKKHPRTGMVDVRVNGATEVIVHDVNPMRTEETAAGFQDANDPNLWHFATEPLYPGLPHIYRVEARFGDAAGGNVQERYVRLIRGRIVTISF